MRALMFVASDECDVRFGHRVGRTDLAIKQRLQPPGFLRVGAVPDQDFHVASVGRGTVEHFRRDHRASHDLAQRRVIEIPQAGTIFAVGQKQVPEPLGSCPRLHLFHHRWRLPGFGVAATWSK